ncbi:acetyl-CoA carboxylase biotin carboxyl carrier protein [Lentibacillus halophilus]|uniref:Biotin carboxyl carrier protein of acetyl-CoA carboxylase n=1 Tax=Lentibacillus halophilus TaxID=295065 RepID=A0ABP3J6C1_9BACI
MLKIQELRELIKIVDESAIDEFSYEEEGTSVTLKKSGNGTTVPTEPTSPVEYRAEPIKQTAPETDAMSEERPVKEQSDADNKTDDSDHEIVSPMVGTFYASPNPESDSYVTTGSEVKNDTVVCIVEAMKLFNEIEAETTGDITEILAEDGELVEYGQPLFRVKKK